MKGNNLMLVRILFIAFFFFSSIASAQTPAKKKSPKKNSVIVPVPDLIISYPDQFPIKKMWDEALNASQWSKRPVLVFNVDYVDSPSIAFRDNVLRIQKVRDYLNKNFELAVNDFSVNPPPSVGFDSLRRLGERLDGLEKGYLIAVRPTAILLRPDSVEIDRISHPEQLTPDEFIARLKDYLVGNGTYAAIRNALWRDTTNMQLRFAYIEKLVERSEYDSTVRHLSVVAQDKKYPSLAKESSKRLANMRFQTERLPNYLLDWTATLDKTKKEDSLDILNSYFDILSMYQARKRIDSISVWYERVLTFIGDREADLLNNYAWDIANFSNKLYDKALALATEAISKNGSEPNYYDTRALVHFLRRELPLAIADAEKALSLAPKTENEYFSDRVKFYREQAKDAEEVREFEKKNNK